MHGQNHIKFTTSHILHNTLTDLLNSIVTASKKNWIDWGVIKHIKNSNKSYNLLFLSFYHH